MTADIRAAAVQAREAFERQWELSNGWLPRRDGDGYASSVITSQWGCFNRGWLAALAAPAPQPSEPFTAKANGIRAGDGQPCPNDHDPDCRWPECLCRDRAAIQQEPKHD